MSKVRMSIEFSALQLIVSQESTDDKTSMRREDVASFLHIKQHVVDPPNHARRSDETDHSRRSSAMGDL